MKNAQTPVGFSEHERKVIDRFMIKKGISKFAAAVRRLLYTSPDYIEAEKEVNGQD